MWVMLCFMWKSCIRYKEQVVEIFKMTWYFMDSPTQPITNFLWLQLTCIQYFWMFCLLKAFRWLPGQNFIWVLLIESSMKAALIIWIIYADECIGFIQKFIHICSECDSHTIASYCQLSNLIRKCLFMHVHKVPS